MRVENGLLTIEGKHREERKHEDPNRRFLRTERVLQSVRRTLRLSSDVEQTPEKIKARYQDGVLKVRTRAGEEGGGRQMSVALVPWRITDAALHRSLLTFLSAAHLICSLSRSRFPSFRSLSALDPSRSLPEWRTNRVRRSHRNRIETSKDGRESKWSRLVAAGQTADVARSDLSPLHAAIRCAATEECPCTSNEQPTTTEPSASLDRRTKLRTRPLRLHAFP